MTSIGIPSTHVLSYNTRPFSLFLNIPHQYRKANLMSNFDNTSRIIQLPEVDVFITMHSITRKAYGTSPYGVGKKRWLDFQTLHNEAAPFIVYLIIPT
ncbi:hypothetical protein TNCV_579631 [Trichonephila clavipes]|nr:hypothetical protein TNCV_579631 [Trichonephila clavipes]